MKTVLSCLFITFVIFSVGLHADTVSLGNYGDVKSVLKAHTNKYVTVVLESGKELTGKVGSVNNDALHLMELSGKEFYDAVIDTDAVEAVVIRMRNN